MAQRKKKMTKKKKNTAGREFNADSDGGDFEIDVQIKDDDSVSLQNIVTRARSFFAL